MTEQELQYDSFRDKNGLYWFKPKMTGHRIKWEDLNAKPIRNVVQQKTLRIAENA